MLVYSKDLALAWLPVLYYSPHMGELLSERKVACCFQICRERVLIMSHDPRVTAAAPIAKISEANVQSRLDASPTAYDFGSPIPHHSFTIIDCQHGAYSLET